MNAEDDQELLYLLLQESLYRQPSTEHSLDAVLNRTGFANLTVCPRCRVDDFIHVEGCSFMFTDETLATKAGGKPSTGHLILRDDAGEETILARLALAGRSEPSTGPGRPDLSDRESKRFPGMYLVSGEELERLFRLDDPLPPGDAGQLRTAPALRTERREAVAMLRRVCEEFGDLDWDAGLHLADIIDKHLYRHLAARDAGEPPPVMETVKAMRTNPGWFKDLPHALRRPARDEIKRVEREGATVRAWWMHEAREPVGRVEVMTIDCLASDGAALELDRQLRGKAGSVVVIEQSDYRVTWTAVPPRIREGAG